MEPFFSHPGTGFGRSFVGHSPSIPVVMDTRGSGRLPGFSCHRGFLAAGIWHSFSAEMKSFSRAFGGRFGDTAEGSSSAFAALSLSRVDKGYWLMTLIRCAFAERSMTTDRAFDML